ncbi:Piso0_000578 [Millerozyma farinosa CBS 7064]|uniref:Superoxide dismutase n=1 Tax=Pichia sorbitophila (strain ATCC MYA-4447 / BCRC 22081 / CBS 7064 / NBRC 10061 / NRRL Y-12695) TaxID=559304 RepID=G8YSR9_PICSO|nr:Piso0_000578 [Millerozyma farinosa CBS 7064]CCE73531.1 Piso0_000578 [Millerozyma farinosa CBS 7064]
MAHLIDQLGTKVTLPQLDWEYNALEPYISGKINEIHHQKHHLTYVNGYNAAIEQLLSAKANDDIKKTIETQQNIKFHGGGHINHALFWKSLLPEKQGGGQPPSENSALGKQIKAQYGSIDKLIGITNAKLAGIQGSGWAFIVKNVEAGNIIEVVTTPNQDTVTSPFVPLVAIDAWEHAYYLQYQNVKADYFKAIWHVINWKEAEKRYGN